MNLIEAVDSENDTLYTPLKIKRAAVFVEKFKGEPSERSARFVREWHKQHGVK